MFNPRKPLAGRALFTAAWAAFLFLLLAGQVHAQGRDIFGYQRGFGPFGKCKLSKPKLTWQVWPGAGSRITQFHVSVNGRLVDAQYDPSAKELWYHFPDALPSGNYEVEGVVIIDDELQMKKHWKFTISEDAVTELPLPGDDQLKALSAVNDIRTSLGLPGVSAEPSLCAAAQGHANYMKECGHVSHEETMAAKSFTGYSLGERVAAFGFVGGTAEDVGYLSKKTYPETIKALFDAPYHRVAFMQPGNPKLGTGVADNRVALDFEMNQVEGITVSPCNGQSGVPSTWDGFESPNPLRNHGGQATVGYPIVIAGFGAKEKHIMVGTAKLSCNGQPVECFLNAPDNDDHLDSAIFLIPVHPLAPGRYDAEADVTLVNGTSQTINWSFTVS